MSAQSPPPRGAWISAEGFLRSGAQPAMVCEGGGGWGKVARRRPFCGMGVLVFEFSRPGPGGRQVSTLSCSAPLAAMAGSAAGVVEAYARAPGGACGRPAQCAQDAGAAARGRRGAPCRLSEGMSHRAGLLKPLSRRLGVAWRPPPDVRPDVTFCLWPPRRGPGRCAVVVCVPISGWGSGRAGRSSLALAVNCVLAF